MIGPFPRLRYVAGGFALLLVLTGTARSDGPSERAVLTKRVIGLLTRVDNLEHAIAQLEKDTRPVAIKPFQPARHLDVWPARSKAWAKREKLARAAVDAGLEWLTAHQSADGGWSAASFGRWCYGRPQDMELEGAGRAENDVGVSALALLAFLGAGYDPLCLHPYSDVSRDALRWLLSQQAPTGFYGKRSSTPHLYGHAVATLAMLEAYGMTGHSVFAESAARALEWIHKARNPYLGWGYGERPEQCTTPITTWMTQVLRIAGRIDAARGLTGLKPAFRIDKRALAGSRLWLDRTADPATGRAGYNGPGTPSVRPRDRLAIFPAAATEALTASAMWTRLVLGVRPDDPRIKRAVSVCLRRLPAWDIPQGTLDMYYWYFGSIALYQTGSKPFKAWSRALHRAVLNQQRQDGTACGYLGSWDPIGAWGGEGGRVYSTAMVVLSLEAPHLYPRWNRVR